MVDGATYDLVLPEKKNLFHFMFKRWHILMDVIRAISCKWINVITLQCFDCICFIAAKGGTLTKSVILDNAFGSLAII